MPRSSLKPSTVITRKSCPRLAPVLDSAKYEGLDGGCADIGRVVGACTRSPVRMCFVLIGVYLEVSLVEDLIELSGKGLHLNVSVQPGVRIRVLYSWSIEWPS
jgi:hypothetical protein